MSFLTHFATFEARRQFFSHGKNVLGYAVLAKSRRRPYVYRTHMKNATFLVTFIAVPLLLVACNKSPNITSDSPQVQAEPFQGQLYRSFDGRMVLTLISRDECELNTRGTTLLCKYTKQSDALRVVATAMGTNQVIYYRFTDQGIQNNDGEVLLSPDRYNAAIEQVRMAQAHQERMRRDAEELKLTEQRRKETALAERRNKYLEWFRTYFAKDQKQPGYYYTRGARNLIYPFTLTLTEKPQVYEDGQYTRCKLFGKMHWHNRKPETVQNIATTQDHEVSVEGVITVPEDGPSELWLYFYWYDPQGKQYIDGREHANCVETIWKPTGENISFIFDKEADGVPLIEEKRGMPANTSKLLIGTWRNEASLNTYFADGTTLIKNNNGSTVKERWSIDGDILTRKTFEVDGRPSKGNFQDKILEITTSSIVGKSIPSGEEWRAERVK